MTDWPRILIDVDDDRPARPDEVEYCQHCAAPVLDGELKLHAGEMRCEECRPWCPECEDVQVGEHGEFCEMVRYLN